MSPVVLVPKYARLGQGFSRAAQARSAEHPGRRTDGTQSAASWLSDLTDAQKTILLCTWCAPKFNPRRHGYRRYYSPDLTSKTDGYTVNGLCDACKGSTVLSGGGRAYIPEAFYAQVCVNPIHARRAARARAGQTSAWARLTSLWGSRRSREAATGASS